MTTRYDNRIILKNQNELYKDIFEERNVNFIRQFNSAEMKYPSVNQISNLTIVERTWSVGDRFYKLSHQYYKTPKYWWVIAWFNKAPTEAHMGLGMTVRIPMPLERILEYLGV